MSADRRQTHADRARKHKMVRNVAGCFLVAIILNSSVAEAKRFGRVYWEAHAKDSVIYEIKTNRKVVALTFDDGPDPTFTPKILHELHDHGAHATFFVIGEKVAHYAKLIRQIRDNGDELANHTYYHRQGRQSVDPNDIMQCDEAIWKVTGLPAAYFRPPGGSLTEQIVAASKATHHQVVMWVDDARDWSRPGPDRIVKNVMSGLHPGAIILFHDGGGDRRQTVTALRRVLEELHDKGYQCVSVSELMRLKEKH